MKQSLFVERYDPDWRRFEAWLDRKEKSGKRDRDNAQPADALADRDVPAAYRRLCQHLALARQRQYSPDLVDRLNRLALRGHHTLYATRKKDAGTFARFVLRDFPRLVRAERRLLYAACVLFYGPLLLLIAALQSYPDFAHYLLSGEQIAQFQDMYDPANRKVGMRESDDNAVMFAFYVWNNVRIGFQTFATGLAFGIGTLVFLFFNGMSIGAVAGHLTAIGYGTPFWSFVSGHSALELTAIVISGAAGFKLGGAVIAPGLLTRKAALVAASRVAVRLMYGAALLFVAAAIVEAFWSPHTIIPPIVKYIVGGVMWIVVIAYLAFSGRAAKAGDGA